MTELAFINCSGVVCVMPGFAESHAVENLTSKPTKHYLKWHHQITHMKHKQCTDGTEVKLKVSESCCPGPASVPSVGVHCCLHLMFTSGLFLALILNLSVNSLPKSVFTYVSVIPVLGGMWNETTVWGWHGATRHKKCSSSSSILFCPEAPWGKNTVLFSTCLNKTRFDYSAWSPKCKRSLWCQAERNLMATAAYLHSSPQLWSCFYSLA